MTTTETKKRTITLTDARPVTIVEADWPVIAEANYEDYDGQVRSQANRITELRMRVRQHADGRALVYGTYSYDTRWQNERGASAKAGLRLKTSENIIEAIKAVGATLIDHDVDEAIVRDAMARCIADLPAEEI